MATDPQAARVLFVQHERDDPPGSLGERAEQRGLVVDVVHARSEGYPDPDAFRAVVVLGSHTSTYENPPWIAAERDFLRRAAHEGVAVLGVCFGAQLLAEALGGGVHPMPAPEVGWLRLRTKAPDLIDPGPWLVWHTDRFAAPPAARVVARTPAAPQAFTAGAHVGVQFHPEMTAACVASWAERYWEPLARAGIDTAEVVAETELRAPQSRRKAHALFDRFYDTRAGRVSRVHADHGVA